MPTSLLAIETALSKCSVTVVIDGNMVVTSEHEKPRSHAEQLVPMIDAAIRTAGIDIATLDAVAVSAGPGSYTGLRIGVSTAKGICYGTGAKLIAVPTLEALALRVYQDELRRYPENELAPIDATQTNDKATFVASSVAVRTPGLIDGSVLIAVAMRARADELYWATFEVRSTGIVPVTQTCILLLDEATTSLVASNHGAVRVLICGSASDLLIADISKRAQRDAYANQLATKITVATRASRPLSSTIAALGMERFDEGRMVDLVSFEPEYLKDFVAAKRKGSIFDQLRL